MKVRSKLKKLISKVSGKYKHLNKQVKCKYKWYGNQYGGFYLSPDYLDQNSIIYSLGIGEDISFDKAVIHQHQCQVYGFDPTPKSIHWIKSQNVHSNFHFYDFGISNRTEKIDFYLPKNSEHVSGSIITHKNINKDNKVNVEMKTLKDTMLQLGHQHIDVLKMDIEGSEYDVIENILNSDIPITQILIEFHDRFFTNGTLKTKQAVKQLNEKGYLIFATSDSFEEVSFIKKESLLNH